MTNTVQRFYQGDLPPRADDIERVRKSLKRGPATRKELLARSNLTLTRTLCAIDALIAAGQATYDPGSKSFAMLGEADKPS